MSPDAIMFHTNNEPSGYYWDEVKKIPTFQVMYRNIPTELFGKELKPTRWIQSKSDIDRVMLLIEYGGVYLDLDVLVIRGFEDLRRKHDCVVGLESSSRVCGSAIACSKDSEFLKLWLNSFIEDYRADFWGYNSGDVPFNLGKQFPELVYLEPDKIQQPNFEHMDQIWSSDATFDWQEHYVVHTLHRLAGRLFLNVPIINPRTIKFMNSTFGQMARNIYYGSPDIHVFRRW